MRRCVTYFWQQCSICQKCSSVFLCVSLARKQTVLCQWHWCWIATCETRSILWSIAGKDMSSRVWRNMTTLLLTAIWQKNSDIHIVIWIYIWFSFSLSGVQCRKVGRRPLCASMCNTSSSWLWWWSWEESGRGSHADKPHLAITVAQPTVGVIKWDRLEVS